MKGKTKQRVGVRGTSWQITVEIPRDPKTGKRRQKLLTAPTKEEVERQAIQLLASIQSGGFGEADADKITVGEYLDRWLDTIADSVRPPTLRRYADLFRLHVPPSLRRTRLAKLTPLDLQQLYSDRLTRGAMRPARTKGAEGAEGSERGLSATTVGVLHNALHHALKDAVKWGLLVRNPADAVTPPRHSAPVCNTWSAEQAVAFLAVASQDDLGALWVLAIYTGMRRGELLGLKWEDVDLVRGQVSVRRTYSRGTKGDFEFGQPKTAKGRRQVAIPAPVVQSLKSHRARQAEHRLHMGSAYHDQNMVFASGLGEPLHPNTLALSFQRLVVAASVPRIRIHDLRHTAATLMLANGEHPKIVQERLGHSDVSMTLNRYSHVTPGMQQAAADRLAALLEGAS